jgi:phage gp36-like protein
MGIYATVTSFSNLIPFGLKGNTSASDDIGVAILSKQIERAEGVINSYLSARYDLPFENVPPMVRALSEDLASAFWIKATYVQDGERANEYWKDFGDPTLKHLDEIRLGKCGLSYTDGSEVSPNTLKRMQSNRSGYRAIFNLDTADAWFVDPELLDLE